MWKLKQFMPKEPSGLDGRMLEVGSLKLQVSNAIAQGGFSSVYLARDALNSSKQYALKHMICQDQESLDLAMKEISVMKMLKDHPNVVTLVAHTILDTGRTKQALLVMEFCEKSLVAALENRGTGYFEEKKALLIFRDVCNAVFAMHCQSPPIAHRDLKAENVLFGPDGAWKLCDFGSVSTNHKCFSKPEEMGIEEDNIRKHTTPAYRAPEMWDLYRREVISEKVDIWALGCLLYRICYLKSAFDGESKLQILNGNFRIPELPKYNSAIINLIKEMLESSPDARPDITQVWFRVNEMLPLELQKDLPDSCIAGSSANAQPSTQVVENEEIKRTNLMLRLSPSHPSSTREHAEKQHSRSSQNTTNAGGGSSLGAFWSTEHAEDSQTTWEKGPVFDKAPVNQVKHKKHPTAHPREHGAITPPRNSIKGPETDISKDFEIRFSPSGIEYVPEKTIVSHAQGKDNFQDKAFNAFVAEFDSSKLNSGENSGTVKGNINIGDQELEEEVSKLKEELKRANLKKEEITSKYKKLSAICRSQQQEIQELKSSLATVSASLIHKDSSTSQDAYATLQSNTPPREKIEGTTAEIHQVSFANSPPETRQETTPWSAFDEKEDFQSVSKNSRPKSVRTVRNVNSNRKSNEELTSSSSSSDAWSFDQDHFTATPSPASATSKAAVGGYAPQRRFSSGNEAKANSDKPTGWAGF